jgi:PAS domain S-box-containing protein
MELSVQTGTGWLVVDELGSVRYRGGDLPPRLTIGHNGRSVGSFSRWMKAIGSDEFREAFQDVKEGRLERTEGQLRKRGKLKFSWTMRALSDATGERSVLLTFKPLPQAAGHSFGKNGPCDAFHLAPVGMFRTSLNGTYLEVNSALAKLYGYASAEEMISKARNGRLQFYVKRHRRLEFVALMGAQGAIEDFQSEIYRADGSKIWITEFARTVQGPQNQPQYYEGTVFDITSHKAAESALRGSREQFRRLLETANVVPWEGDIDGRIRYVGPQAELLLGFPMDEWLRPGFWNERIHPDDREWVKIVRDEAIENLGRFESEYRMLNNNGEVVWVRDIVGLIEAAKGELILGGFLHDITHRRAAEESLRESQDFIEQIARASPLIWYVFDVGLKKIVYLNGGGINALGHAKDALLKMNPFFIPSLAHPDEMADHESHFAKLPAINRGELVEREFRLLAKSGKWMWLRTHETPLKSDETGKARQVVGIAEDITFQQAALEDLANNEALYRRLAETTRVIPFELELTPVRFTYIGPQAEGLLGFPSRQWLSPGFWMSVVHADDCSRVEETLAEAVNRRDAHVEVELRLCDSEGEIHWVRQIVRCEAVEGSLSRCRGFFLDITESKRIETEREESRRRLRELALENQRVREEERRALSREIHDELGQALTLFRLDLTWVGRRISNAVQADAAAPLLVKVQEMEQQIASTLQIVRRITTQLRPPVLDEFGLAEAIEWQANDFSRRVGVRCEVSSQFADCACKETSTMIFRIFQELLTNVARHSKASRVRVFLKQMGGIIYLSVNDNGCGFDLKAAKRNAGFGLLGMRERAESVRGRLQIDSKVGAGTTVTLCVPNVS